MGQVTVTLNDRTYRLGCDDGDEDRLVELATYVKAKLDKLTADVGRAGDERLLLMTALVIADELWDARAEAQAIADAAAATTSIRSAVKPQQSSQVAPQPAAPAEPHEPEQVSRLKSLAAKIAGEQALDDSDETAIAPAPPPPAPPRLGPHNKPRRRDVA